MAPDRSWAFRTTLDGWAEERRLFILDRRHSVGGRLYDRGMFRYVTPRTDREYALEMLTQRFPSSAFNRRRRAQNSLLVRVGSIRRDLLASVSRIRSRIPLDSTEALSINAVLQQDGRADRSFLELGYTWQFAPRHRLSVRHIFSEYKRDLDPTLLYHYSSRRFGRAEVGLTAQNLYSDIIDQQLGTFKNDRDVIRDYVRHPYLVSASYTSPDHLPLRAELTGGFQPTSRAVYQSQTEPEYRYRDDRRVHFLGALLEYRGASYTAGLSHKRDVSWLRRVGTGDEVASDYTARQRLQRWSVFLKGTWGPLRGMGRGVLGSYRDRQTGSNYSESLLPQEVDYDEGQRGLHVRLRYQTQTGAFFGAEYASLLRRYDRESDPGRKENTIAFWPWTGQAWGLGPSNYSLAGKIGYAFEGGRVMLGMGYDIDGDQYKNEDEDYPVKDLGTSRFDGAFGRLLLTW